MLQESLLPREPLQTWLGAEVVTRYWAGTEHLEVGGDWFDVAEMPNGCLAVSIGDVVGRGLYAAAAMGQLRSALRGIAMEGRGPAATLESLDRFAMGTPGAELATVVYGELDQIDRGVLLRVRGPSAAARPDRRRGHDLGRRPFPLARRGVQRTPP